MHVWATSCGYSGDLRLLTAYEGSRCHPDPDAHPDVAQVPGAVSVTRGRRDERSGSQDGVLEKCGKPEGGEVGQSRGGDGGMCGICFVRI